MIRACLMSFGLIVALPVHSYGHARHLSLPTSDRYVQLQPNVVMELITYRIPPESYTIKYVTRDHMVVVQNSGMPDSIKTEIDSHPEIWEKDPRWAVLIYHHHFSRLNSWRTKSFPSLHVTQFGGNAYSIDIDLHAPSFKHPVESLKHIGEVLRHLVTRRATDQRYIYTLLVQGVK